MTTITQNGINAIYFDAYNTAKEFGASDAIAEWHGAYAIEFAVACEQGDTEGQADAEALRWLGPEPT